MGGGAAMWNALRVAGRGVANGSLRGAPMPPAAGQSSMTTPRPASAAVSSQGVKAGEPMPRVVFFAAPSFQEVKAAITDLKEAIDRLYLSNSGDKHEVSTEGSRVSVQSPHSELETKSYESELVPKHAHQALQSLSASSKEHVFQALKFLRASSEAQNVLNSLLSDMWNAASQNSALNDFLHSQDKVARFELKESNIELEELPDSDNETSRPRIGFLHRFNAFKQNMKSTVAGMLRSASGYLFNLSEFFSPENMGSDGAKKLDAFFTDHPMGSDGAEKPDAFYTDHTAMKEALLKFALLVIMVILFKRAW